MSQVIDVMESINYLFISDSVYTEEELYPELCDIPLGVNETHPY